MSKLSRNNLEVADQAKIFNSNGSFHVQVYLEGNSSILTSGSGAPMEYNNPAAALRAIRRVRPDLKVTQI